MLFKKLASRKSKAIIFSLWDCMFPKNLSKLVLVIKKRTEFSGNIRVIADILLKENRHKIYVYKDGKFVPEIKMILETQGATVLEGWSILSLYHLLTSGIFIFSHAPRDAHITKRCRKRMVINLWHGVAFKTIENLMPNIPNKKQEQLQKNATLYDLLIASSEVDKQTNMKAFIVDDSKVHVTGLPRYDILKKTYPLDRFLENQKKLLLNYKQNKTLILYAPTFRESNVSAINQITSKEWDLLSTVLEKNNAIMAIRPHSYDITLPTYLENNRNFCCLVHKEFTETNLILQVTDILLVDFSSIWIDYLLLHRPIIGFAKDYNHYLHKERGFVYNFDTTFPDTFHHSIEALSEHLNQLLISNNLAVDYSQATAKFHKYGIQTNFSLKIKECLRFNILTKHKGNK